MANYKAVANGNWSNLAIWQDDSTGSYVASTVLPGASDVVYFNNFTVQMNVDVTVLQIRNNSATGVTQGGSGVISTSRTVNADLFHAVSSLITVSASSPSVVNITGNMPGTVAASSSNGINCTGNATLNYVGDIQASTSNSINAPTGIRLANGSTLNLTGNIVGGLNTANFGTQNSPIGVRSNTNAIINVVGNVTGGPSGVHNFGILQSTGDIVTITGVVSGGFGSVSGLYNAGVAEEKFHLGRGEIRFFVNVKRERERSVGGLGIRQRTRSVVIFLRDRGRLAGTEELRLFDDERSGFVEAVGVAVGAEQRFL